MFNFKLFETSNKETKGIYLALITAIISGFSIFFNKYAVGVITPPLFFTGMKNVFVALIILALVIGTHKLNTIKKLSAKDIYLLLAIGVIGGAIPFYLFFTGLALVPAINAALLQKTLVIWVALFAGYILKEKMTRTQMFGVAILFIANLLVGGFKGFQFSKGEWMILASSIFWGFEYVLASKALKKIDPDVVILARMGIGSAILLVASLLTSSKNSMHISPQGTMWLSLSVILLLGYVATWYRALKYSTVTTVAGILVASTLITNALTALFVTRSFTPLLMTQTILMSLGIFVIAKATTSNNYNLDSQ